MAFQTSPNAPSFSSSQRPHDDSYWRASVTARSQGDGGGYGGLRGYGLSQSAHHERDYRNGGGGLGKGLSRFFGGQRDLPTYKDKPYFAPRRTAARGYRRRYIFGALGLAMFLLTWISLGRWGGRRSHAHVGLGMAGGYSFMEWVQSVGSGDASSSTLSETIDWSARRELVKEAFKISWDAYEEHGWGYDEYFPISQKGRQMVEGGLGWIIVDALDTMIIMNLTSRVQHARHWIHNSLRYDQDHDVNTFETTIRMLGGLLSAHYLSTTYPDLAPIRDDDIGAPGEDLYIEKATGLADRLLGAFDSSSGIPYASINLNTSEGIKSHADGGASSTAEATTVQLEFKYLAKLTGESEYWEAVEEVMKAVDDQQQQDGLVPIYIYPDNGHFRGEYIRLGSRGDSYYEYLIKQYLQTSEQEPIYKEMWDEALMGIRKHLITYSKSARLTILAERPDGLHGRLLPKMDHLVCFMPGTIALAATGGKPLAEAKASSDWGQLQDEEMRLAKELMKTCWAMYAATKTGLAPEITYFHLDETPVMEADMYPDSTVGRLVTEGIPPDVSTPSSYRSKDLPLISDDLTPLHDSSIGEVPAWRQDIDIHLQDQHNLQRPETVESLFYMYRITGDEIYRQWGWEMFLSFMKYTAVVEDDDRSLFSKTSHFPSHPDHSSSSSESSASDKKTTTLTDSSSFLKSTPKIVGFTSLSNANTIPPIERDNMESFWMAETLKYFYLLFSDRDFLPLETTVFNTEAHPLPRFQLGGDLKTGWKRKPRLSTREGSTSGGAASDGSESETAAQGKAPDGHD